MNWLQESEQVSLIRILIFLILKSFIFIKWYKSSCNECQLDQRSKTEGPVNSPPTSPAQITPEAALLGIYHSPPQWISWSFHHPCCFYTIDNSILHVTNTEVELHHVLPSGICFSAHWFTSLSFGGLKFKFKWPH
jgi:hypothetical protein